MSAEEFVRCFRREKDILLSAFVDASSGSSVACEVATLATSAEQRAALRRILDTAVTDTLYTILLALDGCSSLGGVQQKYRIFDEHENEICSGDGRIEALAHDYFHGDCDA